MPLFGTGPVTVTEEIEIVLPPDPANDVPPILGRNRRERIGNAAKFWMDAADKWAYLGKPAKRDACIAAAQALRFVAQMDAETNSVLSFRSASPLGD